MFFILDSSFHGVWSQEQMATIVMPCLSEVGLPCVLHALIIDYTAEYVATYTHSVKTEFEEIPTGCVLDFKSAENRPLLVCPGPQEIWREIQVGFLNQIPTCLLTEPRVTPAISQLFPDIPIDSSYVGVGGACTPDFKGAFTAWQKNDEFKLCLYTCKPKTDKSWLLNQVLPQGESFYSVGISDTHFWVLSQRSLYRCRYYGSGRTGEWRKVVVLHVGSPHCKMLFNQQGNCMFVVNSDSVQRIFV